MRRLHLTAVLCFAGALGAASPAAALLVNLRLSASEVWFEETTAGAVYTLELHGAAGIRARVAATAFGPEVFLSLPTGTYIQPGDRVRIWETTTMYEIGPLPRISITGIDPGSDVVTGRIWPRRPEVEVHVRNRRLTTGGFVEEEFSRVARTDRAGVFRRDLTAAGGLRRFDVVYAGYRESVFAVYAYSMSPGLDISLGSNEVVLAARFGGSYDLTLFDRAGRVKARSKTHLGAMMGGLGFAEFHRSSGVPVAIESGDRVRVSGPWGFTDVVDQLTMQVDVAADTFRVRARPGAVVYLSVADHIAYRTADAAGEIFHDWTGTHDIAAFDSCGAAYLDRQGNLLRRMQQAFP